VLTDFEGVLRSPQRIGCGPRCAREARASEVNRFRRCWNARP